MPMLVSLIYRVPVPRLVKYLVLALSLKAEEANAYHIGMFCLKFSYTLRHTGMLIRQ